ncbi:Hsp70 family protein [Kineosporia rhizophila]|uniref:Hsp70 family protein n=1 Tax=Kineosporia rhizophila TaxID=84633 RepID=UPI001E36DD25|nr:Hsp70 family protein [Kineosporia rhizophila]MCE0537917.1 Hsp70 family protein [Kineosporia rhizophila]
MSYGLGIDLGSTYTAAAISRDHARAVPAMAPLGSGSPLLRTVVRVSREGGLVVGDDLSSSPDLQNELTGHDFRRHLGDSTSLTLGGRRLSARDLYTEVISAVLVRVARTEGAAPGHVVLTCPATWGPHRREQLAEACRRAGLAPAGFSLCSEAEAVAVAHLSGQPPRNPHQLVVYDVGGGSFDACVVDVERTPDGLVQVRDLGVPDSLEWFGGVDLDQNVLSLVDQACGGAVSQLDPDDPGEADALRRIRAAGVRAKEALAGAQQAEIDIGLPGRTPSVVLTRLHLEEWLRPRLAAALPALRQVLDSARIGRRDRATILLSGGTAAIPMVGRMLAEDLGRPVRLLPDPQFVTALGAAVLAGQAVPEPGPGSPHRPRLRTGVRFALLASGTLAGATGLLMAALGLDGLQP